MVTRAVSARCWRMAIQVASARSSTLTDGDSGGKRPVLADGDSGGKRPVLNLTDGDSGRQASGPGGWRLRRQAPGVCLTNESASQLF